MPFLYALGLKLKLPSGQSFYVVGGFLMLNFNTFQLFGLLLYVFCKLPWTGSLDREHTFFFKLNK